MLDVECSVFVFALVGVGCWVFVFAFVLRSGGFARHREAGVCVGAGGEGDGGQVEPHGETDDDGGRHGDGDECGHQRELGSGREHYAFNVRDEFRSELDQSNPDRNGRGIL